MRHQNVIIPTRHSLDWKGLGYVVSVISVLLLGVIAWPKSGEPAWHAAVLIAGMAASVLGMALRYKAHRDEQREIRRPRSRAETRRL